MVAGAWRAQWPHRDAIRTRLGRKASGNRSRRSRKEAGQPKTNRVAHDRTHHRRCRRDFSETRRLLPALRAPKANPIPVTGNFPGKIEPRRIRARCAGTRVDRELNVSITQTFPWFTFIMRYTHATVRPHCWRVLDWTGEMRGMEGQQFAGRRSMPSTLRLRCPGVPIFKALALPSTLLHYQCGRNGRWDLS